MFPDTPNSSVINVLREPYVFIYTADDERILASHWDPVAGLPGARDVWSLRDLGGRVLREYTVNGGNAPGNWTLSQDYIHRGSHLLASTSPGALAKHFHLDHLGTPRLITGPPGASDTNPDPQTTTFLVGQHNYFPFGEEITNPQQNSLRMRFTGHERDFNAGVGAGDDLDYMHARYYSGLLGRFTSVDPKRRHSPSKLPQRWNRYAYARNNPIKFLDPNGLEELTFQLSTYINQATVGRRFGNFAGGTKTFQQVTVETDRRKAGTNPIVRQSQFEGKTEQRSLFDSKTVIRQGQAPALAPATASFDTQGKVVLTIGVAAANPLVAGAPSIDVSMTATVDPSGKSFDVSASVDGFPTTAAAAVTAEGKQIQISFVDASPLGPLALVDGLEDRRVTTSCTADGCEPARE